MDDEIKNFTKVWLMAITCLCYAYYVSSKIPKGSLRFISLLPIFSLFTFLPLKLFSIHLCGPTAFFLTWLGNFKLLLFSFDLGPLSSKNPPKNLFHFISLASLPIKIKQDPDPKSSSKSKIDSNPFPRISKKLNFGIKFVVLCVLISSYQYKIYLPPYLVSAIYCIYMYVALEIVLAICAAPVRALLEFEIEPQFNEPYLTTSLQDFWGRRWNLMVTSILRPSVYDPIRSIAMHILPYKLVSLPAILATFLVSGLMHEVMYFYLTRASPTGEVTLFFLLHGLCTSIEVVVKKAVASKWRLHQAVSGPLTIVVLAFTGTWLFFPQLLRNGVDDKAMGEYSLFKDFVRYTLVPIFMF